MAHRLLHCKGYKVSHGPVCAVNEAANSMGLHACLG